MRVLLVIVALCVGVFAQDLGGNLNNADSANDAKKTADSTQNPALINSVKSTIEKKFLDFYKNYNIKINFLEVTPLAERNLAKFKVDRIIFDNRDLKKDSGNFEVQIKHNERKKSVFFSFTIDASIDALSAVGNIKSGEVIDKNNTTITQIPLTKNMALPASADILDKYSAKSFIPNGSSITTSKITPKLIVRKGDILAIDYNAKDILISFSVKAMESGAEGQTIRAENLQSGKELKIIIIDSKRGKLVD